MKTILGLLMPALIALSALAAEVTDDTGRMVRLERTAQRILTLSPHATELVFSAGAGDKLVGTVDYSDYPPVAEAIARIGDANRLDRERILALQADLVIAWASGNRPGDLEWLEKQGLAVYRSEPRKLEQIADNIEDIGLLAGTAVEADANARAFRDRLQALSERFGQLEPISIFYQLWPQPLMTVNGEHIIGEVLRLCGGRNLFADLPVLAGQVSREAVILANPQAIVAGANPEQSDPLADWREWPILDAVKQDRLYRVEADLLHRSTPRLLDGAEHLCRQLEAARQPDN